MPMPNAGPVFQEFQQIQEMLGAGYTPEEIEASQKFTVLGTGNRTVNDLVKGTYPGGGLEKQLSFWQQEASGGKKKKKPMASIRKAVRKVASVAAPVIWGPAGAIGAKLIGADKDPISKNPAINALISIAAQKYGPGLLSSMGAGHLPGSKLAPNGPKVGGGVGKTVGAAGEAAAKSPKSLMDVWKGISEAAGGGGGLTGGQKDDGKTAGGFDKDLWRGIRDVRDKAGDAVGGVGNLALLPGLLGGLKDLIGGNDKPGAAPPPVATAPLPAPAPAPPGGGAGRFGLIDSLPRYSATSFSGLPTTEHARDYAQQFDQPGEEDQLARLKARLRGGLMQPQGVR